jgi:hypothetical protein
MSEPCLPREPPEAPQRDSLERSLVRARISALDAERVAGLKLLGELESRIATLRGQLLRIDGACQALQELLAPPDGDAPMGLPQARTQADPH